MARQEDKKKRKNCSLCADKVESIDYKDAAKLKRYLTEAGKIIPRRITGNCAAHQRMIAKAIKKAREAAIISYGTCTRLAYGDCSLHVQRPRRKPPRSPASGHRKRRPL